MLPERAHNPAQIWENYVSFKSDHVKVKGDTERESLSLHRISEPFCFKNIAA